MQVQLTRHLFAYFPQLDGQLLEVEATDVAGVVRALEARAPGVDGEMLITQQLAYGRDRNSPIAMHSD